MLQQNAKSCPGFSAIWLIVVNVIYFIFGVAFIALASWGINAAQANPGGAASFLPAAALQTLVATGVFLLLLAFIGCLGVFYSSKTGGRYLLGCYAFFMILVMIMEFSASLAVFAFLGKLDNTVVPPEALDHVNGDYGTFQLVNMSYYACCCNNLKCPQPKFNMTRNYCWIPKSEPYPCDEVNDFGTFLKQYIDKRIEPVAGLAIFLCLLQFFTSVVACCNQCQGKKQAEKDKIAGAASYEGMDGMYGDKEAEDSVYGKYTGQAGRPGSAAVVQPPPQVATRAPGPPKRPTLGAAPGAAAAAAAGATAGAQAPKA